MLLACAWRARQATRPGRSEASSRASAPRRRRARDSPFAPREKTRARLALISRPAGVSTSAPPQLVAHTMHFALFGIDASSDNKTAAAAGPTDKAATDAAAAHTNELFDANPRTRAISPRSCSSRSRPSRSC